MTRFRDCAACEQFCSGWMNFLRQRSKWPRKRAMIYNATKDWALTRAMLRWRQGEEVVDMIVPTSLFVASQDG